MRPTALFALAAAIATPALAQTQFGSGTVAPDVTSTLSTVAPQSRLSAADYVKLSADALNYRIAADGLAITKAQRDDVKAYASTSRAAAQRQQGVLMASLSNADRKIARPAARLSAQRQPRSTC